MVALFADYDMIQEKDVQDLSGFFELFRDIEVFLWRGQITWRVVMGYDDWVCISCYGCSEYFSRMDDTAIEGSDCYDLSWYNAQVCIKAEYNEGFFFPGLQIFGFIEDFLRVIEFYFMLFWLVYGF